MVGQLVSTQLVLVQVQPSVRALGVGVSTLLFRGSRARSSRVGLRVGFSRAEGSLQQGLMKFDSSPILTLGGGVMVARETHALKEEVRFFLPHTF